MLIVHLLFDTRDAMGANAINTAAEAIAPRLAELTNGRTNLRILSNLADRRTATARCTIPAAELATDDLAATWPGSSKRPTPLPSSTRTGPPRTTRAS
jgi:hydroxymethylglutaryl-CoA reductase